MGDEYDDGEPDVEEDPGDSDLDEELQAQEEADQELQNLDQEGDLPIDAEDPDPDVDAVPEPVKDKKFSVVFSKDDPHHRIIRVVPPDERVSSEIIQREELTEAIGIMTSALEGGMPSPIDAEGITRPIDIARMIVLKNQCPLILRRVMERSQGVEVVEHWPMDEMTISEVSRQFVVSLLERSRATVALQTVKRNELTAKMVKAKANA
jgi:hypothetical protein